jgi:hypothetical protein
MDAILVSGIGNPDGPFRPGQGIATSAAVLQQKLAFDEKKAYALA